MDKEQCSNVEEVKFEEDHTSSQQTLHNSTLKERQHAILVCAGVDSQHIYLKQVVSWRTQASHSLHP